MESRSSRFDPPQRIGGGDLPIAIGVQPRPRQILRHFTASDLIDHVQSIAKCHRSVAADIGRIDQLAFTTRGSLRHKLAAGQRWQQRLQVGANRRPGRASRASRDQSRILQVRIGLPQQKTDDQDPVLERIDVPIAIGIQGIARGCQESLNFRPVVRVDPAGIRAGSSKLAAGWPSMNRTIRIPS